MQNELQRLTTWIYRDETHLAGLPAGVNSSASEGTFSIHHYNEIVILFVIVF